MNYNKPVSIGVRNEDAFFFPRVSKAVEEAVDEEEMSTEDEEVIPSSQTGVTRRGLFEGKKDVNVNETQEVDGDESEIESTPWIKKKRTLL